MKFRIFALFFVICALWGIANANDKISFYLECSQGQKCIDFAYENGKKVSALQTPVQEVTKADIQSAIVNAGGNALPSLTIELSKEASGKFEKITGENIGKKLIVILNDKVLTAPTINAPITSRKIIINGEVGPFWEKTPWLQEVINNSYTAGGRQGMVYVIIALAILIAAVILIVTPRMRQKRPPSME